MFPVSRSFRTPSLRADSWLSGVSLGVLTALLLAGPAMAQGAAAPETLGPVTVQDNVDRNGLNHAPPISTLPTTSIQDTPQAINVIDAKTLQEQGTTTLGEALRNVPGITIAIGEGGTLAGDQFKIRGFDAKDDVYLDGLRDFAAYTRDSFNYQEVQVLKGPSGLMFGRGTTGGAINTISKMPHLGDRYTVQGEAGNGDHVRATADLNYQLSDTAALRLNLMVQDSGVVGRDVTHATRWGIAPSLALGLGTDTQWSLSYMHQHTDAIPDYGMVIVQRPGQLIAEPATEYGVPRQNFTGYSTDRDRNDADIITMKLSHTAADWLTLSNDTRVAAYSRYFQYTTTDTCDFTPATNNCSGTVFSANPAATLAQIGGSGPYQQNSWGVQNIATAKAEFRLGTLRNVAIAGFDAAYQSADRTIYAYHLPTTAQYTYQLGDHTVNRRNIGVAIFNPDHNPPPGYTVFLPTTVASIVNSNATSTTVVNSSGKSTDLALFATDRLYFNDELSLIAGVRVDRYTATYFSKLVDGTSSTAKAPSTIVNPRASLVFEPDQDSTYYVSYSKSAVPQGTSVVGTPTPTTTANQSLDPEKSQTFELGAKHSFFGGALGLAGSLFQVQKSNALITDPATGTASAQSGERDRVQGFELSATGQISDAWSINAAYTFLDSKVTADNSCGGTPAVCKPNPYTVGGPVAFVPKNAASIWTSYKLDGFVPGLGIGGGVVYQSKVFTRLTTTGTAPNPTGIARLAYIPPTVEVDAVATYDTGRLHFQLNVNNIADALNYTQIFVNRGTPSPGRTFIFSVGTSL